MKSRFPPDALHRLGDLFGPKRTMQGEFQAKESTKPNATQAPCSANWPMPLRKARPAANVGAEAPKG